MGRRGRPPYPDILTPREWEVLALLREGLTNEAIAEQLGVTHAAAKYHVSEILSKLGVPTREEAAAWSPEAAQTGRPPREPQLRRWWAGAAGWLRPVTVGKAALVGAAVAVVAGLGVLAWGVLRTDGEGEGSGGAVAGTGTATVVAASPTPTEDELAVREGYARLLEAISRPGQVFHTRAESTTLGPGGFAVDVWIDPDQGVARQELRWDDLLSPSAKKTFIIIGDSLHVGGDVQFTSQVQICPATDSAFLSLIVDCWRVNPSGGPFIYFADLEAEYAGIPAVVLVVVSRPADGPDPSPFAYPPGVQYWVYLNRESFLPIAKLASARPYDGSPPDRADISSYENEFIPDGNLPADFFDPQSLPPIPTAPSPRPGTTAP